MKIIKKSAESARGASLTEYGILAGLIGVISISAVVGLGQRVSETFGSATVTLASKVGDAADGTVDGFIGAPPPLPDEPLILAMSGNSTVRLSGTGTIDWGDGTVEEFDGINVALNHSFVGSEPIDVMIYGTLHQLGDLDGVHALKSFGDIIPINLFQTFKGETVTYLPSDLPSGITSLREIFSGNASFPVTTVENWDVSNVTVFRGLFQSGKPGNIDLSGWQMTAANDIGAMFNNSDFNGTLFDLSQPNQVTSIAGIFARTSYDHPVISTWDVSKVTNFSSAFENNAAFNQDLSNWDVSQGTSFKKTFTGARAFDQDLSAWDVSNGKTFETMFSGATSFTGPIFTTVGPNATTIAGMFGNASAFNGDLSSWDVSNVTTMQTAFSNTDAFNGDITGWVTSSVTDMDQMFAGSTAFNRNISNWDTSGVTTMEGMFSNTTAFNHDLSDWCVTNIPAKPFEFDLNAAAWSAARPDWGQCNP